jgi:NAD(P)-dependent dehydrogenase (short-subunit alcohol dehydrogenase family)
MSISPFGPHTTADEVLEGADLAGVVAVVTGASSGLGEEVARSLRDHGATVVAAVRTPSKSRDRPVQLDLSSLESVREAASAITCEFDRVDVLFNNAGVMATPELRTADGFELQIGTNHLGHFLFTALLAPALGSHGRIVNTTSLGHMIGGMRWSDPHFRVDPYDKWLAYGQSKSANILFTRGLSERGFDAYAVHPGAIDTGLTRHLEGEELAFVEQTSSAEAKSLAAGAATLLWAATAEGIPAGAYLADCGISTAAQHATDPSEVARLWSWSEEQVGHRFDR